MKADYTDITVLVDRSGSMSSIKDDMEGGLRAFVEEHRKDNDDTRLTYVFFDDRYTVGFTEKSVQSVERSDLKLEPRGSTALYYSMKRVIEDTGRRLAAKDESQRPSQVHILVVTDGGENCPHLGVFSKDVKELVEHQRSKYAWNFIFLGANQDAVLVGETLGVHSGHSMTYAPSAVGAMNMFASTANVTRGLKGMSHEIYKKTVLDGNNKLYSTADRDAAMQY